MGPFGGTVALLLGFLLCLASIAGAAKWFHEQAESYPQQPSKHTQLVNVGLLTVIPTIAIIVIVSVTLYGMYNGEIYDIFDIVPFAIAMIVLLYAVFRGDCVQGTRRLPFPFCMCMILATGMSLIHVGRLARGKGYNDWVEAQVTGWKALDQDTSLISFSYETDSGRHCEVSLEMDCTRYWSDISKEYEEEAKEGDDDKAKDYDDYYWTRLDYTRMYEQDNYEQLIQSTMYYEDDDERDFSCRYGFERGDQQGENEENGEDRRLEEQQNENEYPQIDSVLINSHKCKATWYTSEEYNKSYTWSQPHRSVWICGLTALVSGLILGAWELCPRAEFDDKAVEMLPTSEQEATADYAPAAHSTTLV